MFRTCHCFILVCCLSFLSSPLWAIRPYQPTIPDPSEEPWRWHAYTALDRNDIFCLAQGTDGAVWFGIDGGAVRYDGLDWQHYGGGRELTGEAVVDFAVSPSGFVYAACMQGGISVFSKGHWERLFPEDPSQKLSLSNLELDEEGGLWASIPEGLIHWSRGTSTLYVLPNCDLSERHRLLFDYVTPMGFQGISDESSLLLGGLHRMHIGQHGTIVGSTRNHYLLYTSFPSMTTQTQWSLAKVPPDVAKTGACRALLQTEDGKVWVLFGTFDSSLGCFDPQTGQWEVFSLNEKFGVEQGYCSITQTQDGAVWVAAYRSLFRFYQGAWTMYRQEHIPIRNNPVMLLMAGANDSLWIGGKHNEVVRLDMSQGRWQTLEGLIYQGEDQSGATWYISRTHRIVCCRQNQWHSYESVGLVDVRPRDFSGDWQITYTISRASTKRLYILADKSIGQEIRITSPTVSISSKSIITPDSLPFTITDELAEQYDIGLLNLDNSSLGEVMINTHYDRPVTEDIFQVPLRGIKMIADWISEDYADKLDKNGKDQLVLLSKQVDRMYFLIEGILKYSRAGHLNNQVEKINLDDLMPQIISMVSAPDHIDITIDGKLPVIESEQTKVTQIFQNLLSNAIKYIDKPHGHIRIGCAEEDDTWKFSIIDNGPGIDKKNYKKIFQLFQTLKSRDGIESTGIGLSLVKKIVESYEGTVWVESELGQGSTFFFTLPKQDNSINEEKFETSVIG